MSRLLRSPAYYQIVRNPNIHSNGETRVYDRENIFENSFRLLEDPANNRKLYLFGTLNSSELLAKRTEKMLDQIDYSSLLVQTTPKWFEHVKKSSYNVRVRILFGF